MLARDLRKKYIEFFTNKGHKLIKSAPLIPENDPTVLFTTAGMHPLVPFLIGKKHPLGKRLVGVQKCVRTGDIDEVGDISHLTFFEMLGNWSLGDYFKNISIKYSYDFLTSPEWLNIPKEKLAFTVFKGDDDAPFDEEAYNSWKELGVPNSRIAKLGKKDNWWGPAGQTGPCGPDSEMFCWIGSEDAPVNFDPEDSRWVEIWNNVFMEYNKNEEGKFSVLNTKNVDTGMGLERVTAILQGKDSCYETELFIPLFEKLDEIKGCKNSVKIDSDRIIVDHLRTAAFMLADGVIPGNVDQSYILRRLIRRSVREGRKLGIDTIFTAEIAQVVIDEYSDIYPELSDSADNIIKELTDEEKQFAHALEKGTREFEKVISKVPEHIKKKVLSGKIAFFLYETYGFPIELTEEMAAERGFVVDKAGYDKAYKKHQELSRQGAEQKFKGGLADASEQTTALHTATHLLHEALRRVLGEHVAQKGSNITSDRLRFDFSHPEKMTKEEIIKVEKLVNDTIESKLSVSFSEVTVDEAKKSGAIGLFGDKYGEKVNVYSIGNFSREICGGPHVENLKELGTFKIKKEESSSRGVRRIKAVLI
ncbi:MAG TPA: alanine--tRNA ligase [Victivallales bacterium]|nr:alanine--tRNA ligase [Victivallales bacterium]